MTFIGDGPERALRARGCGGYAPNVTFAGALSGQTLVEQLNRHRIMAVPSVFNEPRYRGARRRSLRLCRCGVIRGGSGGCHRTVRPHLSERRCPPAPDPELGELLESPQRVDAFAAAPAHLSAAHGRGRGGTAFDVFRKTIATA